MTSAPSHIANLAAAIAENTLRIDRYLADSDSPYPSFDAHAPVDLHLPPELEQARATVLQATQELNDLLQGPRDLLFNHHVSCVLTQES